MLSHYYRFHGRRSLSFLFRQGKTVRRKAMSLKYTQNPRRQEPRFAVVVGKKVSKSAPVRNRIRRRVYEVIRHQLPSVQTGGDFAFFIYDESVATMPHAELEELVVGLLSDCGK